MSFACSYFSAVEDLRISEDVSKAILCNQRLHEEDYTESMSLLRMTKYANKGNEHRGAGRGDGSGEESYREEGV